MRAGDLDESGSAEDDSPFLSIADFFSLISLAVIYIVISFAPQSPFANAGIESVTTTAVPSGMTSTLDPRFAYVSVLDSSQGVLVRIIPAQNQSPKQRNFPLTEAGEHSALQWTLRTLRAPVQPKRVFVYIHVDEPTGEVHKVFDDILSAAGATYPVKPIFFQSGEMSP